jgi:membrane protease YdiL (CAAX protease family)
MIGAATNTGVADRPRRLPIFVCLAAMLIYPLFAAKMETITGDLASKIGEIPSRFATEGAIWSFAAVVLFIALFGEPRTLASIALKRPTLLTPIWGVGAAVGVLMLVGLASFLSYKALHAPNETVAKYEALVRGSLVYALFLALRGGVVEEVLYRGLAIEQMTVLTGQRWLAALIAGVIFVLAHTVHFDLHQLVPIAAATFGMTAIYLWRRNLWINIIAHALVDAVALVVVALRVTQLY